MTTPEGSYEGPSSVEYDRASRLIIDFARGSISEDIVMEEIKRAGKHYPVALIAGIRDLRDRLDGRDSGDPLQTITNAYSDLGYHEDDEGPKDEDIQRIEQSLDSLEKKISG